MKVRSRSRSFPAQSFHPSAPHAGAASGASGGSVESRGWQQQRAEGCSRPGDEIRVQSQRPKRKHTVDQELDLVPRDTGCRVCDAHLRTKAAHLDEMAAVAVAQLANHVAFVRVLL